jgi:16S rRNA A1518/A1519 N6-dimethyltransferase RsmA/KsgA/DIM1 with predicted DNA glycosylase/AP lyase activity
MNLGRDEQWQVVANIPFHISEPFLKKMTNGKLPIDDMILVLGENLVRSLFTTDTQSIHFSKLGLLGRSFFDITHLHAVDPEGFYPPAHTAAGIVQMIPHTRQGMLTPRQMMYQALFQSEATGATVAKVLKETIDRAQEVVKPGISKNEMHRQSRRNVKRYLQEVTSDYNRKSTGQGGSPQRHQGVKTVQSLGIPSGLLSVPFSRFSNTDVKTLVQILDSQFQ